MVKFKKIKLTKGKFAIVDPDDYERISQNKWYCSTHGYAVRTERTETGRKMYFMHREIMNCPKNKEVDHVKHNKLDNRKSSLRICSRKENNRNLRKLKTNTSGYVGVSFVKRINKFRAYINLNDKQINLGYYTDSKDAAIAYNKAAKKYHKAFAKINKV